MTGKKSSTSSFADELRRFSLLPAALASELLPLPLALCGVVPAWTRRRGGEGGDAIDDEDENNVVAMAEAAGGGDCSDMADTISKL